MTDREALYNLEHIYGILSPDIQRSLDIAIKYIEERMRGRWIPVSARLPEEEDYRPCYGLPDGCVMWQTDNGNIGFGWYYRSTECWSDLNDNPIKTGKVIAWQPLPEPYKKGSAER